MANFRKIIVLFAFVCAFIGSTFATVLDLPANTPGRQVIPHGQPNAGNPALVQRNANGVLTQCEHVIIPTTAHNIYFPIDGVQPTTEEAIQYSCANIPCINPNTDLITNWYMQMFGIVAAGIGNVQAGWNNPHGGAPAATKIIHFVFNEFTQQLSQDLLNIIPHVTNPVARTGNPIDLNGTDLTTRNAGQLENDINATTAPHLLQLAQDLEADRLQIVAHWIATNPQADQNVIWARQRLEWLSAQLTALAHGQTVQQFINHVRQNFIDNFRILASTSVGRVLLYRLLIEINRRHNAGVTTGCCENGITIPGLIPPAPFTIRDCNRMIRIGLGNFEFVRGGGALAPIYAGININNILPLLDVVGGNYGNDDIITQDNVTFDTTLFHEMIHWYHCLRAPDRMEQEFWNDNQNLETNFLWMHYWGTLRGADKKLFAKYKWRSPLAEFDLEEVRTILGSYRLVNSHYPTNEKIYFEGDDLSENLYRACAGLPLRFGYNSPLSSESCNTIFRY